MRRIVMLTTAALVTMSLAGCGDDDGVATTEAAGTQAPSTTQAAPPETTQATAPETTQTAATTEAPAPPTETTAAEAAVLAVGSSGFEDGGEIPVVFSCDGDNLSPELAFTGIPAGTTSLALTVIDPDGGDWVHWIVWNIPPDSTGIPEGARAGATLPDGSLQAINDFGPVFDFGDLFPGGAPVKITGWDGPCPGPQTHSYVFTLYALTGTIDLPGASEAADILAAIASARADGSLIGEATLTGLYPAPG